MKYVEILTEAEVLPACRSELFLVNRGWQLSVGSELFLVNRGRQLSVGGSELFLVNRGRQLNVGW